MVKVTVATNLPEVKSILAGGVSKPQKNTNTLSNGNLN